MVLVHVGLLRVVVFLRLDEGADFLAVCRVPEDYCAAGVARGQEFAVGRQGEAPDLPLGNVPARSPNLLAGRQGPEIDLAPLGRR